MILIYLLSFILRIPSFSFPLDFDVGLHLFYGAQALKHGFYSTTQALVPVGILTIFSLIYKIFGTATVWINIIGALFWVFSTYLVSRITEVIFSSRRTTFFSALIFAFFASSRALQGEMANMETFFIPLGLLGVYFFFKYYLFLSGFFFGLAFLTKHLSAFDFLAIFLFGLFSFKRKSRLVVLIFGFLSTILLVSFYFFLKGQLQDFFYWQFIDIHSHVSGFSSFGSALVNLKNNFRPIFAKTYFFWLLFLGGVISSLSFKRQAERCFIFFWFLTVFGGIYYLWWFFPHHFLQLIPSASILIGLFLTDLDEFAKKRFGVGLLIVTLILFFQADAVYFTSFAQRLQGQISQEQHLAAVGFDVGPDGWLPFYKASDYLKKETKPEARVFIWESTPVLYVLANKDPISRLIYKYEFLPDELRTRSFQGWFPNVENSRKELMENLLQKFPEYILVRVEPEKIFDELFSFSELSSFIVNNYVFEQRFDNILLYKKSKAEPEMKKSKIIPLEIVKRFAVITNLEENEGRTRIVFEPMVNSQGILRRFEAIYPGVVKVDFLPISGQLLGRDHDFVGWAKYQPSGAIDLHFWIQGAQKPISFIRIKMDEITWNSRSYGVNQVLQVIQKGETLDLFCEPPSDWQGKTFEIYIIYEDGSVSRLNIPGKAKL